MGAYVEYSGESLDHYDNNSMYQGSLNKPWNFAGARYYTVNMKFLARFLSWQCFYSCGIDGSSGIIVCTVIVVC